MQFELTLRNLAGGSRRSLIVEAVSFETALSRALSRGWYLKSEEEVIKIEKEFVIDDNFNKKV